MNIAQFREKGNTLLARVPRDVLIVALLVLTSSASFGLGILAGQGAAGPSTGSGQGSAFSISQIPMTEDAPAAAAAAGTTALPASIPAGGQVVASKNGTKYFLPWCAGAKLISAANLVTFASAADAAAKGYTPAANCKGL